jgi:hypothetical protein
VDLEAGSVSYRAYAVEGNPPILHRKETMLAPEDPRAPALAALTAAAERVGLFIDPNGHRDEAGRGMLLL